MHAAAVRWLCRFHTRGTRIVSYGYPQQVNLSVIKLSFTTHYSQQGPFRRRGSLLPVLHCGCFKHGA